jgi:NAD+ kinase
MKIAIYTNKYKDEDYRLTKFALEYLTAKRAEVFVDKSIGGAIGADVFEFKKGAADALVVFGGDGTILGVCEKAAKAGIPILGINTGSFGFLTEAENDGLEGALNQLLRKKYFIDRRAMLMTEHNGARHYALNDIVFLRDASRHTPKKLIRFEVYSDGELVDKVSADGIIVSTPTGSTAYSLSSGGPILSPHLAAIAVTAICPHSLHFRPIVMGDNQKIKAGFIGEGLKATIIFDGVNKFSIGEGQYIQIEKAGIEAEFIRFGGANFYAKLRSKMNKWSVT